MVAVLAIDAGTTGVRTRAVFSDARPAISSYREFTQYYPQPGWVEHDPNEIWDAVVATFNDVASQVDDVIAAIGITNQRETIVAWDKTTGSPLHRAIVWQDRRTATRCEQLAPQLDRVRHVTGLVLDPYFSGTKAAWLLAEGGVPRSENLALGTIDSWIVWNLTNGDFFVTDPSNASRTMLFDINTLSWSDEMCELLGVPRSALAEIVASSGRIAVTSHPQLPPGIPISGIAGDQQAALFGQACFTPGMAKNTYGTGSFVLLNVGSSCPKPTEGMLTTVAWTLSDGHVAYALEGSIFATGAAVQWLRDGLNIIDTSSQVQDLAASVPDTGGVFVVPAFAGLGSPWWDPYARGTIVGITRGTNRAHIARATVEAMSYQTRDVIDAMASAAGLRLSELRVDGGAAVNDDLMQHQANELGVKVVRPRDPETTAVGAAYLAGLAEGVWASLDHIAASWSVDVEFQPGEESGNYTQWRRAVQRSLDWAPH